MEDPKNALILQGNKVRQVVKDVLSDISRLKHDQAIRYTRKNDVHPFEAETSMQFFCERSACALFCLGNHNKKRPHNIVLGRTFDAQLLDMVELGVLEHTPLARFPAASKLLAGSTVRICEILCSFACHVTPPASHSHHAQRHHVRSECRSGRTKGKGRG